MKTPDEIKKGLECCTLQDGNMYTDCSHCPYYLTSSHCDLEMHKDALSYIQQLEAELEIREIQKNAMFAKAEQLERERDSLLKYFTDSHWAACDICKHEPESHDINDCMRIRQIGIPCFERKGLPEV